MKNFNEWLESQYYQSSLDGPPLQPNSIPGAENQIKTLSINIRHLSRNKQFPKSVQESIFRATELLDQAANQLTGTDEEALQARSIKI